MGANESHLADLSVEQKKAALDAQAIGLSQDYIKQYREQWTVFDEAYTAQESTSLPQAPTLVRSSKNDARPMQPARRKDVGSDRTQDVKSETFHPNVPARPQETVASSSTVRLPKRSVPMQPDDEDEDEDLLQQFQPRKAPRKASSRPRAGSDAEADELPDSVSASYVALKYTGSRSSEPSGAKAPTIEERPPAWYNRLKVVPTRNKNESNAESVLDRLKGNMNKGIAAQDDVRRDLHTLTFVEVSRQLLRNKRMLHDADGLPRLFDPAHNQGIAWPYDIKADAEELYNKWCRGVFETDLLRGIIAGKSSIKIRGEVVKGQSTSLDSRHAKDRIDPHYYGNGLLLNGQWWPMQICLLRDGAHGETQGGITGGSEGVYSCIMAGGRDPDGKPYPDVDDGDRILYCGTDQTNKSGEPSSATQYMLNSIGKQPVRLIRSSNCHSEWAPEEGYRYDGLYSVVGSERMRDVDATRQRYRFELKRLPDQDPIRARGPEKRPTQQEVDAWRKDRQYRGLKN